MIKETLKYHFSVEGETEKHYFLWLRNIINRNEDRTHNVKFFIKVCDSPKSFAKGLAPLVPIEAFHITDFESLDDYHLNKFLSEIDEMNYVVKHMKKRIKKYLLGYSNLTFELWIILHKKDSFIPLNHRDEYLPLINKAYNKNYEGLSDFKKEREFQNILDTLSLINVVEAIQRAKQIMKRNELNGYKIKEFKKHNYLSENPSLSIHEIVEKILIDVGLL